jgi:hypothetical protein
VDQVFEAGAHFWAKLAEIIIQNSCLVLEMDDGGAAACLGHSIELGQAEFQGSAGCCQSRGSRRVRKSSSGLSADSRNATIPYKTGNPKFLANLQIFGDFFKLCTKVDKKYQSSSLQPLE